MVAPLKKRNQQSGYILILVMVVICVIALSMTLWANQTVGSSFFAARRGSTVQSFSLAESAALEAYWRLRQNPEYRSGQNRYWGSEWYGFTIIDNTPWSVNDLSLDVLGRGNAGGKMRGVRLRLSRSSTDSAFRIVSWSEEN